VIAQQVARRPGGRISLGSNPDVTADLIPVLHERERAGTQVAVIGQVNDRMPFMFGAAEIAESSIDYVVDAPGLYHELVCTAQPADLDRRARDRARDEHADPRRRDDPDRHRRARRRDRACDDPQAPRQR
jgi:hypothetical protein